MTKKNPKSAPRRTRFGRRAAKKFLAAYKEAWETRNPSWPPACSPAKLIIGRPLSASPPSAAKLSLATGRRQPTPRKTSASASALPV